MTIDNHLTAQEKALWQKTMDTEFIIEHGCYNKCSSFCCRWDSPNMPFRIIPKGGTLFYLPKEYEYIKEYGKVTNNECYKITAKCGDNKTITLLYKHCNDDCNCNKLFSRSLYCKLYPFLPVLDINGKLLDLKYISVYDITADIKGVKTPCYVKDLKSKYLNMWQGNCDIDLLKEPYILFHLMAANILHDNYVEILKSNVDLLQLEGREFWKKWEKSYLSGRLINKEKLEHDLTSLHDNFISQYGNIL